MSPEFASIVDPIFELALSVFDRLESGDSVVAREAREQFLIQFQSGDAQLGESKHWRLAKYAIASWIDEIMLSADPIDKDWWRENILEMELFQSRLSHTRFFELAEQSAMLRSRDSLEVFLNCVTLGFRGMYASDTSQQSNEQMEGLEGSTVDRDVTNGSIEEWLDRMSRRVTVVGVPRYAEGRYRLIDGAKPSFAREQLVWWAIACLGLILINGAIYQIFLSGGGRT